MLILFSKCKVTTINYRFGEFRVNVTIKILNDKGIQLTHSFKDHLIIAKIIPKFIICLLFIS